MVMRGVIAALGCLAAFAAGAHDFSADIAKFNAVAASRKPDSDQAVAAKLALERAQAEIEQADIKMLLRIRALTNTGLKALGEQPAFLGSEIKRLETALASPKTTDPAKLAEAREALARLQVEKTVYDTLENSAVEQMKRATQLIEAAPAK
jgi:hypothetical protein